jgi:site-specific DNA-cytosine methylase
MKHQKKITYASIIPLIGGETIGCMTALNGQPPEYILSYTPFAGHDRLLLEYLRTTKNWKGEYINIDQSPDHSPKSVDFVQSVCPCAGLSSLSTTSSGDSAVNEWLYTSARYVLGNVKPTVFWGENAPRLYSPMGRKVADTLFKIGKENGYTFSIYYTESRLHGLSQKRPRTFYFFTKRDDNKVPLIPRFKRDPEPIQNIFAIPVAAEDPMNLVGNKTDPMDDPWIRYCMAKVGVKTLPEYFAQMTESEPMIYQTQFLSNDFDGVSDWFKANGLEKHAHKVDHMHAKVKQNMGYWGHGTTIGKGVIPSLVAHLPTSLVDAERGRFMTMRDCLRIMKMPDDFVIRPEGDESPLRHMNKICQSVAVTTAADMADFVVKYCTDPDSIECVNGSYVRQNNRTGDVSVDPIGMPDRGSLSEFL